MAKERNPQDVGPTDSAPRGGAEEAPAVEAETEVQTSRKTARPRRYSPDELRELGLIRSGDPAAEPSGRQPAPTNLGGRIGSGIQNLIVKAPRKVKVGCGCAVVSILAIGILAGSCGAFVRGVTGTPNSPGGHQYPPPPPNPGPVQTTPTPTPNGDHLNMQVQILQANDKHYPDGTDHLGVYIRVTNPTASDSPDNFLMVRDSQGDLLGMYGANFTVGGTCNYIDSSDPTRVAIGLGGPSGYVNGDIPAGTSYDCTPYLIGTAVKGSFQVLDYANGNNTPSESIPWICNPPSTGGLCRPSTGASANAQAANPNTATSTLVAPTGARREEFGLE